MSRVFGSRNINPREPYLYSLSESISAFIHRPYLQSSDDLIIGVPLMSGDSSMSYRSHPRGHLERTGQRNWRKPLDVNGTTSVGQNSSSPSDPSRSSRFDREPDHVIFTTKSKHSGSDNQDSQPMPARTAEIARQIFPPSNFFRYQVNFYLKGK